MQKIYNIESLHEGDLKTYQTIHDSVLYHRNRSEDLDYELFRVNTKKELFNTLTEIENEITIVDEDSTPFLHFDVHGNKEGIETRSREFVTWDEILDSLIGINISCRSFLILSVGACFGFAAVQTIRTEKRAPFCLIIGANKNVTPVQINNFYKDFFRYALHGELRNYLDNSSLIPEYFSVFGITQLYNDIFKMRSTNKQGIFDKHFEDWKTKIDKSLHSKSENELKELFEMGLYLFHQGQRKENYEHFFMLDLFPENKEWYQVE